jgi:hypothetical protein
MAIARRGGTTSTRRAIRRAVRRQTKASRVRRLRRPQQKPANFALSPLEAGSDDFGVALPLVGRPASVATQYRAKRQRERQCLIRNVLVGHASFAITVGFAVI